MPSMTVSARPSTVWGRGERDDEKTEGYSAEWHRDPPKTNGYGHACLGEQRERREEQAGRSPTPTEQLHDQHSSDDQKEAQGSGALELNRKVTELNRQFTPPSTPPGHLRGAHRMRASPRSSNRG